MSHRSLPRRVVIADDDIGNLGGISTAIRTLSEAFRERGARVEYVSLNAPLPDAGLIGSVFEVNHRRSMTSDHPLAAAYPGRCGARFAAKRMLTRPWRIRRRLRLEHYFGRLGPDDLLISMKPRIGSLVAEQVAARRRKGLAVPIHIFQFHYAFDHWYRPLHDEALRAIAKSCDTLVALWPQDARLFATHYGAPVHVIKNAIPMIEAAISTRSSVPCRTIGIATRLAADKRVDLAVRAFDRASDRVPGWRLRIHGEGEARAEVESAVRSSRHAASISLGPALHPTGVHDLLDRCDLTLLTSEAEGLPMAILESAAHGVPVVATPSAPAVCDLVSDIGYLSTDHSVDAVAEALIRAMEDAAGRARRGQQGAQMVREFDPDLICDQWIALFENHRRSRAEMGVDGIG